MLKDQYSFPCHLAKDSTPFFHLIRTPRCNPGKSVDLGSSFQKHLIKVHRAPPIVKPPGISLWIRAQLKPRCISSFGMCLPENKHPPHCGSFHPIREDKSRSCVLSSFESEIESDLHEIVGWGLQKINGLKYSCLILWLSQLVHPQKKSHPICEKHEATRVLQQMKINSWLP